jgi:uncharacterized membrane protein
VLGRNADRGLILVMPLLSSALGLLWCGHHIDIARIATYIRLELWVWDPSWEHWASERPHRRHWTRSFWWAVVLAFCGIPLGALAIGLPLHRGSLAIWALWSAGVVVTVFTTARFVVHIRSGFWAPYSPPYGGD